ncbi:MAG TPA: glycerate kinase [Verrucomicrobiae bacterium]|nr:glycerate kinase [Verrucomicrobiae bacterium]
MSLNVLIAPDKFKGTLTARAAAEAMARGWRQMRPTDNVTLFPISDGGDGFGELVGASLEAETQTVATVDAAHQPCEAGWWWEPKSRTAIIEAARVNGLARLPAGRHHPFDLDTFGLGAVIAAAYTKGARHCLVGIGGSATNDGGFGMARALGWGFFDEREAVIERWTGLHSLSRCQPPQTAGWSKEILVAVDVQNPLLGPSGSTRVYGPQKGLRENDFDLAERCLARLADVMESQSGCRAANEPGAGAAGGLGFGLRSFIGARLVPGFDLFAEHTGLKTRIEDADLVITGEGAIDQSTLMGKGVGELAILCREARKACLGLAGAVTDRVAAARFFTRAYAMAPDLTDRATAMANNAEWLMRLAAHAANLWNNSQAYL